MLKTVHMVNIQSHKDTLLEFPETGIITFIGDNSDGKSVFTKVLRRLITGEVKQPIIRNGLITWGQPWAELTLDRYDGKCLKAHIALESCENYIDYTDSVSGEVYHRTFRDRGYEDLLRLFGFHYNESRGVSLNLYNTFDALLFVNTPPVTNDSLFAECLSDPKVDTALQRAKEFKELLENKTSQVSQEQSELRVHLDAIVVYNVERETEYDNKFKAFQEQLIVLYKTQKELEPLPNYKTLPDVNLSSVAALRKCLLAPPVVVTPRTAPAYDKVSSRGLYNCLSRLPILSTVTPKPEVNPNIAALTRVTSFYMNRSLIDYAELWEESRKELLEVKDKRCPFCQRSFV